MAPELSRILASREAYRRQLAGRSIGDKLRMLDALRERELAIPGRGAHPTATIVPPARPSHAVGEASANANRKWASNPSGKGANADADSCIKVVASRRKPLSELARDFGAPRCKTFPRPGDESVPSARSGSEREETAPPERRSVGAVLQ